MGFWFNEQGGISYPNKKEVMLLSDELRYCGKEFVVKDVVDITAHNHITLDSPNSSVRIVNICPSVLELVEVEEEDEETTFKSGDRVRIKQVDELLELDTRSRVMETYVIQTTVFFLISIKCDIVDESSLL